MRLSTKRVLLCAVSSASLFFGATASFGAAFTPGDLVVVRVGTGAAALSTASTATFLDEYNTTTLAQTSTVQTIALPTAVSGSNKPLTLSNSTAEGFLTISTNGQYLTMAGYGTAPGLAGVGTSVSTTTNRVVARIDMNGNIDTTTSLSDASTGSTVRSALYDGTNIWIAGGAGGVRATTLGATTSTQLSTTVANVRVVNIFGGQLYTSSMSGAFRGINTIGTGTPTTSGQTTTLLSGFDPSTSAPESAYDYYLANSTTLYVADDRTTTTLNTGGLQKWTFNGSTWSLAYTLTSGLTSGLRGLTGSLDASGNAVLYATTADAANNKLVSITDSLSASTLPGSEAFATLATSGANELFRGVEAVPEPTSLTLLGGGLTMFLGRRSRRRA